MKHPIKYSNCWEDAQRLGHALRIGPDSRVMTIASRGDNSLYLLRFGPARLLCVDTSAEQLYLTQLKECALRRLGYVDFLSFLGFSPGEQRAGVYEDLRTELLPDARAFFDQNLHLITEGIIHAGKFEGYFRLFAHRVLPLIHTRHTVAQLLAPKDATAQAHYYTHHWNTLRWRLLFRLFFSRFVMGRWGRDPEKLKHVTGHVGQLIYDRAAAHLSDMACQHNHILDYALTGQFGAHLPPYVQRPYFEAIQQWLQTHHLEYEHNPLDKALPRHHGFDRFNLSNIFEYMDADAFADHVALLSRHAADTAVVAYWNLMVPRHIQQPPWRGMHPPGADLGFFYQSFNTYER